VNPPEAGATLDRWVAFIADAEDDEEGARRLGVAMAGGANPCLLVQAQRRVEETRAA
jgi:hypothetical protein